MVGAGAEGGHGQLRVHEDEGDDAEDGMRVGGQVGLEERIRAFLFDGEGDAERAEEDAGQHHERVRHEPALQRGLAAHLVWRGTTGCPTVSVPTLFAANSVIC